MRKLICIAVLALSGCATIVDGTTQEIALSTEPEQNAECTLSNSAGSWKISTPGNIQVHKSASTLAVTCTKAGYLESKKFVSAKTAPNTHGNILTGGLIGSLVDASSGAMNQYPAAIVVSMERVR